MSFGTTTFPYELVDNIGTGPSIGKPYWEYYSGLKSEREFENASSRMRDNESSFVSQFFGETFKNYHTFEKEGGLYYISEEEVSKIVDSIQVEIKDGENVKKGTYREVYNIPEITGSNQSAVMAHLTYNMIAGDLQKGCLDKNAVMFVSKPGEYNRRLGGYEMEHIVIEPYMKDVADARKKVFQAQEKPRPVLPLTGAAKYIGKFMNWIGFKHSYGKTYADYQEKLNRYNEETRLTKERELVSKYREAYDSALDVVVEYVRADNMKKRENAFEKNNVDEMSESLSSNNSLEMEESLRSSSNDKVKVINSDNLIKKINNENNINNEDNKEEKLPAPGKKVSKITLYARKLEEEKKHQNVL